MGEVTFDSEFVFTMPPSSVGLLKQLYLVALLETKINILVIEFIYTFCAL